MIYLIEGGHVKELFALRESHQDLFRLARNCVDEDDAGQVLFVGWRLPVTLRSAEQCKDGVEKPDCLLHGLLSLLRFPGLILTCR